MVHIKVIRGSRLLLCVAVLALAAVAVLLAIRFLPGKETSVNTTASLVEATESDEAETEQVFASSSEYHGAPASMRLPLDPESPVIDIEIVPIATPTSVPSPRILIYHTHTHEAYAQTEDDPYEALEAWRTSDSDHSVVRVGEALADALRDLGFEVTHDCTDHEGDELATAYTRSLETLRAYDEPFDLYIDLHRDAYVPGEETVHTTVSGARMARLMLLIGNGNGFDEKPFYAENLAFAKALEKRINDIEPGLCKPVLVKDGRYNQNIGIFSILVEFGHNQNRLDEALNSAPVLAKAICSLLIESPDPGLEGLRR